MKLTINQIAELAQVSKGTVSKVLNGHKGISTPTRERILKLVQQLDYHPDSSARALALQKTGVFGFLIPHEAATSLTGHYWTMVLSGISQQATQMGYNIMILTTPREGDIKGALNQILKRSSVDGLIIGSELLDKESLSTLVLNKIPFVLLGQNPDFQHWCVDIDSLHGTTLLIDHMARRGFRKIGALFGPAQYPYVKERRHGYLRALQANGLEWVAEASSDYDGASIRRNLARLLDAHPDMDALYLGSGGDFLLDAYKLLHERGIRIPEFGLGVFDDYPFFDLLSPRITAVRQPVFQAGQEAVTLLQSLAQETPPDKFLVQLKTTLVVRESCGELIPEK
jgi:LacI family transcriptional regulator